MKRHHRIFLRNFIRKIVVPLLTVACGIGPTNFVTLLAVVAAWVAFCVISAGIEHENSETGSNAGTVFVFGLAGMIALYATDEIFFCAILGCFTAFALLHFIYEKKHYLAELRAEQQQREREQRAVATMLEQTPHGSQRFATADDLRAAGHAFDDWNNRA